jgi:adenosine kinase
VRITTLGRNGAMITGNGLESIQVGVARQMQAYDPTGVGDGFRAGFFAARAWGLDLRRCAEVGALLATMVLETVGTQEYQIRPEEFLKRLAESYGDASAAEVAAHLPG